MLQLFLFTANNNVNHYTFYNHKKIKLSTFLRTFKANSICIIPYIFIFQGVVKRKINLYVLANMLTHVVPHAQV